MRDIIRQSNVEVICTTDDPADSLVWHKKIAGDTSFRTNVYPTFRPDKALAVDKPGYAEYIKKLSGSFGRQITTLDDLYNALSSRLDFFVECGCRSSDHGLDTVPWDPRPINNNSVFKRALLGETISSSEAESFKTAIMLFLGSEYAKRGVVMQLHYGAMRNLNPRYYKSLGADTGFDSIGTPDCCTALAAYLGALESDGSLPKTILYSINPNDNAMLVSLAGTFPQAGIPGKVQSGSAWWFNDTKNGIESHLYTLAGIGVLGCFVGMLTDSRSFLSYTRHEYFRRILCGFLGSMVCNGELPNDIKWLGSIVRDISYYNAKQYFAF